MSLIYPFKEDFFERVADITWEDQPEVYWVAGTGFPLIINGMVGGDQRAWIYTSEDGIHWEGTDAGHHAGPGEWGIGGLYTGCWMREDLRAGTATRDAAPPVWVMAGGDGQFQMSSGATYSMNGKTLGGWTKWDEKHVGEVISRGNKEIICTSMSNMDFHIDRFRSKNGRTWRPSHFHPWTPGGGGAAVAGADTAVTEMLISPLQRPSPVASVVVPDKNPDFAAIAEKLFVPSRRSSLLVPQPLVGDDPAVVRSADKMVFNLSSNKATGKVRKGENAGKVLRIEIIPYHHIPGGGDHGDSTVVVTDVTPDSADFGKQLGTVDVGMTRSINIGYGHYVFVVGGGTASGGVAGSGASDTMISYSEDGKNWKASTLGQHSQINPLCVGPRPKQELKALHPSEPQS
jgi:hypothetical protein